MQQPQPDIAPSGARRSLPISNQMMRAVLRVAENRRGGGRRKSFSSKAFGRLDPIASLHPPVKSCRWFAIFVWDRVFDPVRRPERPQGFRVESGKRKSLLFHSNSPPRHVRIPHKHVSQRLVGGLSDPDAWSQCECRGRDIHLRRSTDCPWRRLRSQPLSRVAADAKRLASRPGPLLSLTRSLGL